LVYFSAPSSELVNEVIEGWISNSAVWVYKWGAFAQEKYLFFHFRLCIHLTIALNYQKQHIPIHR
jgi:hypothetical protein